jgi:hypothetical protein
MTEEERKKSKDFQSMNPKIFNCGLVIGYNKVRIRLSEDLLL